MIESDSPPSVQFQQDDRMDRPEKNPSLNTIIDTISPRLDNIIDTISPRPSTDSEQEPEKDDSEYMLKWGAHNGELISVFHELRQDGHLTDVTLSTEDDQFLAHQLVLSACSPYFRHLFTKSPCKHPIIFLKEVPSEHIRLLLDYMYKGCISVKQNDLEHILRTATSLKIRGLATEEAPKDAEKDKFQRIETGSNHSGRSSSSCGRREKREGGRKSSKPKRLRLSHSMSGDSGVSSPRHQNWMDCYQDPERPLVISEPDTATGTSPTNGLRLVDSKSLMDTRHSSGNTSPLDSIAESEGEDHQHIDPNQPVDFSKNDQLTPRFSILGNHIKNGNGRNSKTPDQGRRFDEDLKVERRFEENRKNEHSIVDSKRQEMSGILTGTALEEAAARMNAMAPKLDAASGLAGLNSLAAAAGWMNPLSGLGGQNPLASLSNLLDRSQQLGHQPQPRPSSRDSRMSDSDTSAEDLVKEPKKHSPTGMPPLPAVPTLDLADQLRSAMMAMQPSHLSSAHYAYLNGVGGVSSPAHTPASSDSYAKPKNPVGGYKTGEVGPNGKQPVACEVCGKKLTDPSSLYRHRKIHSGDKPHKCPYCDRRFIQRYNMKQHIKTHKMELLADKSNWDLLPKNHDLGDLEEQHRHQAQENWERDQRNWEVAVPGNHDVAAVMESEDEPLNMTA